MSSVNTETKALNMNVISQQIMIDADLLSHLFGAYVFPSFQYTST